MNVRYPRATFCLALLAVIFFCAASASANLYFYKPLMAAPAPEEVFAFASQPPRPTTVQDPPRAASRQMSREDLFLFLREATVDPLNAKPRPADDPVFSPKDDGEIGCNGVFFTRKGTAYFWYLCDTQTLLLVTTDYRACYLRLKQSRVQAHAVPRGEDEFHPLQPPAAKEVLSFANADRPGTGFQLLRSKDYILRFLREGKTLHYDTFFEQYQIRKPARVTLTDSLAKRYAAFGIPFPDRRVNVLEADLEVAGAFATKEGQVYFWEQWGDDVIQISDTTGAECALKLSSGEKARTQASAKSKAIPAK